MASGKGSDEEKSAEPRNEKHRTEEQNSRKESPGKVGVALETKAEKGIFAPAVEAVEKPCKGEGGESHGHGDGSAAPEPDIVGGHGRHGNKPALHRDFGEELLIKNGAGGVPRLLVKKPVPCGLHAEGNRREGVGHKVNKEKVYRRERRGKPRQRRIEHREDSGGVAGEKEADGVFNVGVNGSAVYDGFDNGREVVVRKYHRGGVLADLRSRNAHGDADVRLFKRRGVVDAVSGHGNYGTSSLPGVYDSYFVLRRDPGIDRNLGKNFVELALAHIFKLRAAQSDVPVFENADLPCNGGGGDLVVAGYHNGADSRPGGVRYGFDRFGAGRIHHRAEPNENKVVFKAEVEVFGNFGKLPIAEGENPEPEV